MIALLDKAWSCLEALGTLPMADGEVFFAKYLRSYPILAHYYSQGKAYYNERAYDSERDTAKSERHAHRARRLVSWLEKLKLEWAENPEMLAFLREHPDPSPLRDVVALEELAVLIRGDSWRGEFACDSDTVRLYIETRNRFISAKEYRRTADNRNAEALYDFAVNTYKARATRYLLQEYCGVHGAGEEDLELWMRFARSDGFPESQIRKQAKFLVNEKVKEVYDLELELLDKAREQGRPAAPAEQTP